MLTLSYSFASVLLQCHYQTEVTGFNSPVPVFPQNKPELNGKVIIHFHYVYGLFISLCVFISSTGNARPLMWHNLRWSTISSSIVLLIHSNDVTWPEVNSSYVTPCRSTLTFFVVYFILVVTFLYNLTIFTLVFLMSLLLLNNVQIICIDHFFTKCNIFPL